MSRTAQLLIHDFILMNSPESFWTFPHKSSVSLLFGSLGLHGFSLELFHETFKLTDSFTKVRLSPYVLWVLLLDCEGSTGF